MCCSIACLHSFNFREKKQKQNFNVPIGHTDNKNSVPGSKTVCHGHSLIIPLEMRLKRVEERKRVEEGNREEGVYSLELRK